MNVNLSWTLTWRDHVFTVADMNEGLAALVQQQTRDGWRSLDPTAGPEHAGNLLAVLVAAAENRPLDGVLRDIASAPLLEVLAAVSD